MAASSSLLSFSSSSYIPCHAQISTYLSSSSSYVPIIARRALILFTAVPQISISFSHHLDTCQASVVPQIRSLTLIFSNTTSEIRTSHPAFCTLSNPASSSLLLQHQHQTSPSKQTSVHTINTLLKQLQSEFKRPRTWRLLVSGSWMPGCGIEGCCLVPRLQTAAA